MEYIKKDGIIKTVNSTEAMIYIQQGWQKSSEQEFEKANKSAMSAYSSPKTSLE